MMDQLMASIHTLQASFSSVLMALDGVTVALIAICMIIPGEQPEKFLGQVLDVIRKYSKK